MRFSSESGQSTVEAAVLLPILLVVFGLLLQPAVLLYNRCIMNAAATEGCRLITTNVGGDTTIQAYVERHLGAIPKIPIFHVGEEWAINWSRASDGTANVIIENHVDPLPFFGILAGLTDAIGDDGAIVQRVDVFCSPVPDWVAGQGYDPSRWIGVWE